MKLDASALPPFKPTKEVVQCANRPMTALEWAYSSTVPPMARMIFSQEGGADNDILRANTTPQMQFNYSMLHIANHYLSVQKVRKFLLTNEENNNAIVLEITGLRACPEDVKGVLPRHAFHDPMNVDLPLGALPIFFVRYLYERDFKNPSSRKAAKSMEGLVMRVIAASVDEIAYAHKELQRGHSLCKTSKANESVLYPRQITKTKPAGKAEYVCASCDSIITKRPAPSCSKCDVTFYCNRECQVAHWKTHKKACGKTLPEDSNTGSRKSIVFDIHDAKHPALQTMQTDTCMTSLNFLTGNTSVVGLNKEKRSELRDSVRNSGANVSKMPTAKNIHGDREFIVKIQPPVAISAGGPWMCYDGPVRSFQAYISSDTPGLSEVYSLLQRDGICVSVPMMRSAIGYKGYLKAKWEGSSIRVFYDRVVSHQKW